MTEMGKGVVKEGRGLHESWAKTEMGEDSLESISDTSEGVPTCHPRSCLSSQLRAPLSWVRLCETRGQKQS